MCILIYIVWVRMTSLWHHWNDGECIGESPRNGSMITAVFSLGNYCNSAIIYIFNHIYLYIYIYTHKSHHEKRGCKPQNTPWNIHSCQKSAGLMAGFIITSGLTHWVRATFTNSGPPQARKYPSNIENFLQSLRRKKHIFFLSHCKVSESGKINSSLNFREKHIHHSDTTYL